MADQEILKGRRVAILLTNGFEEVEFTEPKKALENSGANIDVIAPEGPQVKAWDMKDWGNSYNVDKTLDEANHADYDALLLPGGVLNPDQLRMNQKAVEFAKMFFEEGKPVAAICHGPQLLIETGVLEGRTMTSYYSIKTDLINAGVNWVDKEVVVDNGLVSSRNPDDIPAFCNKMVEEFREGIHERHSMI